MTIDVKGRTAINAFMWYFGSSWSESKHFWDSLTPDEKIYYRAVVLSF